MPFSLPKVKITKFSFPSVCFALIFFLLPLFCTPFTFEYYQTGKLILLFALFVSLAIFYIFQVSQAKKIQLLPSPFYLPIALLLFFFLISTVFSINATDSFLGPHGRYHGGFLSYLIYFGIFFFSLNLLKDKDQDGILKASVFGGLLLAILFTLQYFEIYLFPFEVTHQRFWTAISSTTSVGGYLVMLLPIALWLALKTSDRFRVFYCFVFLFFVFDIALLNLPFFWLALLAGFFVLILSLKDRIFSRPYRFLLITLFLGVLVSLFSFGGIRRLVLPEKYLGLPQEVVLPFSTSWQITTAILANRPLLGIGPGNFGLYYPQLRPASTISLPTFQVRFNQAGSEALELLSSLGIVGGLGLVLLVVSLLRSVAIRDRRYDSDPGSAFFLATSAFAGVVLLSTTRGSVSLLALFFLILGLWSRQLAGGKRIEIAFPKFSFLDGRKRREREFPTALVIIGTLSILLLISVVWGRTILADRAYVKASSAVSTGDGERALTFINQAQNLSPQRDEFAIGSATINLALASALSNQASPSAQIQDQIALFAQQALNSARRATALNPQKVTNWENLASVYNNLLTYLPGADQAMVDAYQQAVRLDPLNPVLFKLLGDAFVTARMGDQAVASYQQAISLRPDLVGAYLGLARVYKAAGQNEQAKQVYEQILSFGFDETSRDYQIIKGEYEEVKKAVEEGGEGGVVEVEPVRGGEGKEIR